MSMNERRVQLTTTVMGSLLFVLLTGLWAYLWVR
jgi:hypothetical protein